MQILRASFCTPSIWSLRPCWWGDHTRAAYSKSGWTYSFTAVCSFKLAIRSSSSGYPRHNPFTSSVLLAAYIFDRSSSCVAQHHDFSLGYPVIFWTDTWQADIMKWRLCGARWGSPRAPIYGNQGVYSDATAGPLLFRASSAVLPHYLRSTRFRIVSAAFPQRFRSVSASCASDDQGLRTITLLVTKNARNTLTCSGGMIAWNSGTYAFSVVFHFHFPPYTRQFFYSLYMFCHLKVRVSSPTVKFLHGSQAANMISLKCTVIKQPILCSAGLDVGEAQIEIGWEIHKATP